MKEKRGVIRKSSVKAWRGESGGIGVGRNAKENNRRETSAKYGEK